MLKTTTSPIKLSAIAFTVFTSPALSEPIIELGEYLETMDRTEVFFSGRIKFDSSEDSFTFYNKDREWFHVAMDAGRDAREQIEEKCNNPRSMVSYSDLCEISGHGTVEIRGSRIFLSIEAVEKLKK